MKISYVAPPRATTTELEKIAAFFEAKIGLAAKYGIPARQEALILRYAMDALKAGR